MSGLLLVTQTRANLRKKFPIIIWPVITCTAPPVISLENLTEKSPVENRKCQVTGPGKRLLLC